MNLDCPVPHHERARLLLGHGAGGRLTAELLEKLVLPALDSPVGSPLEDAALLPSQPDLVVSTDSFVVSPLSFPGGDIGDLAVPKAGVRSGWIDWLQRVIDGIEPDAPAEEGDDLIVAEIARLDVLILIVVIKIHAELITAALADKLRQHAGVRHLGRVARGADEHFLERSVIEIEAGGQAEVACGLAVPLRADRLGCVLQHDQIVLGSDFVRTARAKGLRERVVVAVDRSAAPVDAASVVPATGVEEWRQEGELFRRVLGWSLLLLLIMCVIVLLQSTAVLSWMVV